MAASKTITDQSIASYTSPGRRALTRTSTTTVAVKAIEDETRPNEVAAMAAAKSDTGTRMRRGSNTSLRFASGRKPRSSEEHTSELQSLMRIAYAVFCLKKT